MRNFDSDGTTIHYVDEGQGEPILLIHGLTGSHDEWRAPGIIDDLSRDYRIIALDVRGHGQSDKPHEIARYGVEFSEDVARLLDHLGIERAHIVGYSMGAMIAGRFVADHAARALSVVFGGLAPDPAFVAPVPGAPPPPLPEPTPEELVEIKARTDPEAIEAIIPSFRTLALTDEEIASLDLPMLAIIGSEDPLIFTVDAFAKARPAMEVLVIDGAKHSGPTGAQAHPDFIAELRRFLAGD